jgi:hypothetical protein
MQDSQSYFKFVEQRYQFTSGGKITISVERQNYKTNGSNNKKLVPILLSLLPSLEK